MTSVRDNWNSVCSRVEDAARSAGRRPESVTIVAVSKRHSARAVVEAFEAGARDFGENYLEELLQKKAEVDELLGERCGEVRWHFIGNLQSRKIGDLEGAGIVLLHAIDRSSQLKQFRKLDEPQTALVQVNTSGESSKGGVAPDAVEEYVARAVETANLRVVGLMCMPAPGDLDAAARDFDLTADLLDACRRIAGEGFSELSMGMSGDFPLAIAAGATLVRVGTAIFGPRT